MEKDSKDQVQRIFNWIVIVKQHGRYKCHYGPFSTKLAAGEFRKSHLSYVENQDIQLKELISLVI